MTGKKLKILYIDFAIPHLIRDNDFPSGGAAVEWLSWIEGIRQTGNEIGILTWKGATKFINKELDFDIIESYNLKKGIPFIRFFYYRLPNILRAVKNYNPDVIIQEGSRGLTFIGVFISKILGKVFIYRIASDKDVDGRIKKKLSKRELFLYRVALKNTNIFICQNEYQYKTLKNKFPDKRIVILYNPFVIKKDLANLNNNRYYIAWIGNFRYEKNVAALLPIAKALPDINFKIAGKPSRDIDKVSLHALDKLKTLNNVELVGYLKRSEIIPFLSNAHALLNTSFLEGFSNTFLEAWVAGTPVITTKNVNPDDIITRYNLGVVADTYDDLSVIIKKIVNSNNDENLRYKYRQYVEEHHNPQNLAEKLIKVILS
jgi:glycosyltransferase involved in cell wall biosynthesis